MHRLSSSYSQVLRFVMSKLRTFGDFLMARGNYFLKLHISVLILYNEYQFSLSDHSFFLTFSHSLSHSQHGATHGLVFTLTKTRQSTVIRRLIFFCFKSIVHVFFLCIVILCWIFIVQDYVLQTFIETTTLYNFIFNSSIWLYHGCDNFPRDIKYLHRLTWQQYNHITDNT